MKIKDTIVNPYLIDIKIAVKTTRKINFERYIKGVFKYFRRMDM